MRMKKKIEKAKSSPVTLDQLGWETASDNERLSYVVKPKCQDALNLMRWELPLLDLSGAEREHRGKQLEEGKWI